MKLGANVILESTEGITLQLRDDLFLWGIFGGLVKDGEEPRAAAIREVQEELTIRLEPRRLSFMKVFEGPQHTTHLYHYPLAVDELSGAVLTEGIRFETKKPSSLQSHEVVPWHWQMLKWYWSKGQLQSTG